MGRLLVLLTCLGLAFGAGKLAEWRIRRTCSPFEAWGAWQLSRFAEHAQRCLNVVSGPRLKISRRENVLRLVTVYDRERSPIQSRLPRRSKRQRLSDLILPP